MNQTAMNNDEFDKAVHRLRCAMKAAEAACEGVRKAAENLPEELYQALFGQGVAFSRNVLLISTRAPARLMTCLRTWYSREDLETVTLLEVSQIGRRRLLRVRGMGTKTLFELEEVLKEHGLKLKP